MRKWLSKGHLYGILRGLRESKYQNFPGAGPLDPPGRAYSATPDPPAEKLGSCAASVQLRCKLENAVVNHIHDDIFWLPLPS